MSIKDVSSLKCSEGIAKDFVAFTNAVETIFGDKVATPIMLDISQLNNAELIDLYVLEHCRELGFNVETDDVKWCVHMSYNTSYNYDLTHTLDQMIVSESVYVCSLAEAFIVLVIDHDLTKGENRCVTIENADNPICQAAQSYYSLTESLFGEHVCHCVIINGEAHIFC